MKMIKNIFLAGLLLFTSVFATSCGAETPYIGNNGNWWLGSSDLGVPATGSAGVDGKSVSVVSVEKTSTDGFVDTYTITFSDGTKTTFTVTNGKDGTSVYIESISKTDSDGRVDTYTIIFSNGHQHTFKITNGKNGESIKITSIEKTATNGLVDTYVISFSDEQQHHLL